MLDLNGVIQDVTLSNAVSDELVDDWRGRPWVETVGDGVSGKVMRMVEDARESGVSAYRQVNQRFPSGLEIPMEYTTVRLGGKAGLIAIGRNLQAVAELQSRLIAAQQAMEQEYWKLREVETRYRLLFDASNEAVLLLKADTLRIIEANPAAIRALGLARGRDILPDMAAEEREPFQAMLQRVRQSGRAPGVLLHLGPDRAAWLVRASLMTSDPGPVFLVQLAPASGAPDPDAGGRASHIGRIRRSPAGWLRGDRPGWHYPARQSRIPRPRAGRRRGRAVGRAAEPVSVAPRRRPDRAARPICSAMARCACSKPAFRAISAAKRRWKSPLPAAGNGNAPARSGLIALLMRDVSRRLSTPKETTTLQSALAAIIEQTGKTSLRGLVKDTVGLVERHYMVAALDLANGNRTAAAEILGMSRQGFYKKLAQYEMDGHSRAGPYSDK